MQQQLETTVNELRTAKQRIEELEKKLGGSTTKLDEAYSMREEEKRQEDRGQKKKRPEKRKKKRGRVKSQDKIDQAERTEQIFPEGVAESDCQLSHCRVQRDQRLGDAGRVRKMAGLADQIFDLCADQW